MKDPLESKGENRTNQKSPGSGWQQLLKLSERLLALSHTIPSARSETLESNPMQAGGAIVAQCDLIIETAASLFGGQVEIWLPRWLGLETGCLSRESQAVEADASQADALFSALPAAHLARCAIETRQACYGDSRRKITALSIPLLTPDIGNGSTVVLGVISIRRPSGPAFKKAEREQFESLAIQAASALQTSRQITVDRWKAEQIATISEVGNAITSILNQEDLLHQIVNLIHDRLGFPFVHLFSVHNGRRKIFFEAGSGSRSQTLTEQEFVYDLDDPQGLIPWVAQHGQTVLANDVHRDNRYRPAPIFPDETLSELSIPLKFGHEILGVLDIQSKQVDAFGPQDQFLLETLADGIAIALRNASLYRSEQWRRQVADSLSQVAGMISAEVDLDEVLSAILAKLEHNLPCDLAAIWFLDEEQAKTNGNSETPILRLAALHGADAVWLESQVGLNLDEILEPATPPMGGLPTDTLSEQQVSWIFDALQSEQPVTRPKDSEQDAFGAALDFPADYSGVSAALRVGDRRLGLLTLMHHTPGRYGSEARSMASAFANYAAVAIQNTQLYEAAHEQVWVSTVLLQVAEATQSLDDLNELLTTVVNITPMLVGVKACALYLSGEDGTFFPAAASGLDVDMQDEFDRRRFSPGDVPALDHLREDMHPTIIQRQGDDLRLASLFLRSDRKADALELLVLAPLLAHGEVLGALLVQYLSDPLKSALQGLETFFDERLSILQGIAHQTATAVENIYLIKSQKEEAYVSVALLQVAQAIVTSTDLHETLGSIVRITPILTGVKRVALYLLDRKSAQLRLAQSYGLPRDADTTPYTLDEFPLLAAALERDEIVAVPISTVLDDEWEDVPEIWTCLAAPEPQAVGENLASEARLLEAIPLSVTGEALGVLLVEEPDPSRSSERSSASSNLRLRPKRLEITTGISQQAALAIQNDHLKGEMFIRERLEREMQLAREIQRTFLPNQLPDLPGWDLKVWWRTAREMGGDFYDVFELPGGRLGLVIADVADKGMPAALFMVLTRTLLRASAKDSISPAEVLRQVNELLAPDAQQGMFVTLFYAVFEVQSGRFTYANTGQNPPMWARKEEQTIELLSRSGMALGVLEDLQVEERTLTLMPGDHLVMYTDGVTDTFSPDGLDYGLERLRQCVWEAAFGDDRPPASAGSMLQAIDDSLQAFMDGEPPGDDSTVLVLFHRPDSA